MTYTHGSGFHIWVYSFLSPAPFLTLLFPILVVISLLVFRLWAFSIKPRFHQEAPRELPYWIPYFGHAIEFINNGQGLITRTREYFHNTREPFALTLGGEKLYFLTSPDDVQSFYRNTSSLGFESVVYELGIAFGVSKSAMDSSYVRPESEAKDVVSQVLGTRNSRLKSLAELNKEFWKMQLHPGKHYEDIQANFVREIESRLAHIGLPASSIYREESKSRKIVSLLQLTQRVLVEATLSVFFGKTLLQNFPSLVQDFLDFDDENWKLWYKWPRATKMFASKNRMAKAIEQYLRFTDEERGDASFIIKTFISSQRALGTSDADLSKVLCMLVFVMNTNTYKACFWAVTYLFEDSKFLSQVNQELAGAFSTDGNMDPQYLADSCPRLSSLVLEVLRFCSASSSMRVTMKNTFIGGKLIPANSRVMVPTRELHFNDAAFGLRCHDFVPDRFQENTSLEKNASFRPFGGGVSHCPGRFIAAQEVKIFLAFLLRNFNVELAENIMPKLELKKPTTGIMGPKGDGDLLLRLSVKS